MNEIETSSFHDANFNGIIVEQNKAELSFRLSTGVAVKVLLDNLNRLLCNDFREGNIVLEVTVSSDISICEPLLDILFPKPAGMLDQHYSFMELTRNKLLKGELVILHIAPSYGGDLVALCEGARILNSN
jgi:hypothetical protein